MSESNTPPPLVLIADDVLGGFFALNGGRFSSGMQNVWYFSPDSLEWEDTARGYSDFLSWTFVGDLELFYRPYRWPGWRNDVAKLAGDQGFSIFPFLSTEGPDIARRSRKPVPIRELFMLHLGAV